MAQKLQLPKYPKPIRAAAIIETAHGVLLVQDIKDHFMMQTLKTLGDDYNKYVERRKRQQANRKMAAMSIVSRGRFSLPGGKIEPIDYTLAGAEDLLKLDRMPRTREELEQFRDVIREAAIREVGEEIGTLVYCEQVPPIIEIHGRERHHVICMMRVEGEINLEPKPDQPRENSGIGFLNEHNIIPLNRFFYQSHVRKVLDKYVKKPYRRETMIPRYLSHVRVPKYYMDQWYENLQNGYTNRPCGYRKRTPVPGFPSSSPTYIIFDERNVIHNPFVPPSFTDTTKARIVPPQSDSLNSIGEEINFESAADTAPRELTEMVVQPRIKRALPAVREISETMLLAIMNSAVVYEEDELDGPDQAATITAPLVAGGKTIIKKPPTRI